MISAIAKKICNEIDDDATKLGDIKRRGKDIKRDHALAVELWSTQKFHPRMLATLIFDKKRLDLNAIELLAVDMIDHEDDERHQLADWMLANQLSKGKPTLALLGEWSTHSSPVLRRLLVSPGPTALGGKGATSG